ncbi:MAG: hypothetical protein JSS57_07225 [Proteobacteria bacterium]|nr:hypothetical protein [Pseudomonadota bacterium]
MTERSKPTPGPAIAVHNVLKPCDEAHARSFVRPVHSEGWQICQTVGPNGPANADFIAEAFTVHHETGLTPQQLREALADVARTALDFIEPWMKDRKYPETPEEWCAQHNADVPDAIYAARDRARTAIAKVEGRS